MKDVLSLCARAQPDHGTRYAAALARLLDGSLSALVVCEPVTDIMAATQPAAAGLLVAWQQDRLAHAHDAAGTLPRLRASLGRLRLLHPDSRAVREHEIELLHRMGLRDEAARIAADTTEGSRPLCRARSCAQCQRQRQKHTAEVTKERRVRREEQQDLPCVLCGPSRPLR